MWLYFSDTVPTNNPIRERAIVRILPVQLCVVVCMQSLNPSSPYFYVYQQVVVCCTREENALSERECVCVCVCVVVACSFFLCNKPSRTQINLYMYNIHTRETSRTQRDNHPPACVRFSPFVHYPALIPIRSQ